VFFTQDRAPMIVLPELEKEKLKNLPFEVESFLYGEDPQQWNLVFLQTVRKAKLVGKRNGVEPRQLRLLEFRLLLDAVPMDYFISADSCVSRLRMSKDESELVSMRKAVQIAEQALTATLPFLKIGLSENELASELTMQLFKAGCDPQAPFSPIVSAGPNSANPHATPSDRKLIEGDLLVIDWGASFEGYFSDITRTFAIGNIDTEYAQIANIVLDANTAARNIARPGIPIENIDRAARSVIESAGYGKYFTHRTGHGLGMEGHEEPYIRSGNTAFLEPGMTFTIEPGIYLPDRNGVRIEDDVVITDSGVECLTSLPRELIRVV